jgi:hypothetical protein
MSAPLSGKDSFTPYENSRLGIGNGYPGAVDFAAREASWDSCSGKWLCGAGVVATILSLAVAGFPPLLWSVFPGLLVGGLALILLVGGAAMLVAGFLLGSRAVEKEAMARKFLACDVAEQITGIGGKADDLAKIPSCADGELDGKLESLGWKSLCKDLIGSDALYRLNREFDKYCGNYGGAMDAKYEDVEATKGLLQSNAGRTMALFHQTLAIFGQNDTDKKFAVAVWMNIPEDIAGERHRHYALTQTAKQVVEVLQRAQENSGIGIRDIIAYVEGPSDRFGVLKSAGGQMKGWIKECLLSHVYPGEGSSRSGNRAPVAAGEVVPSQKIPAAQSA